MLKYGLGSLHTRMTQDWRPANRGARKRRYGVSHDWSLRIVGPVSAYKGL